jgi:cation transport ATPase
MFSPVLAMGPVTYLIIHLVLLVLLAGINAPLLSDGFSRLFSRTPTIGSGVALSVLVSTIHTAVQLLNTTGVADGSTPLMTSIAGLGIFLLLLAKCLEKGRQYRNVGWVLNESEEKTVYKRINDPSLAEEIGRPALAIGEPQVAYYRKTATIHGYTEISDDTLVCTPQMKWYLPTVFSVSLLISLVYFAINGLTSWIVTVTLFCAMITVSAPALLLFALQLAHAGAAHTAEKEGVTITGYQAVENFGSVHALALDAMDIFPEQSVLLHGIKTFSGTRIDDAILDAASVSVRAGGPLSHVFRRMIQNKVDMLREVDTLVYEQDMGLSGWVNGRRVLIGNRKLLDNHGIDIPSKDYEQRYAKNGRQLVYLSIAGELSAMFVVSYVADPKIKDVLTTLTKNRITLLVRTCDQNITERLIATVFDLNGFYVELLNAPAGRSFEGLVDGVSQSEKSGMISDGRKEGLIFALAICRRLKTGIRLFSVLQALIAAVGIALIGYTAVFQGLIFPPLYTIEILFGAALLFATSSVFFGKK